MDPYHHDQEEEECFQAVASFEDFSYAANQEPLIVTSPSSASAGGMNLHPQDEEPRHDCHGIRSITARRYNNNHLLYVQESTTFDSDDDDDVYSLMLAPASNVLGFTISFFLHCSVIVSRILLHQELNDSSTYFPTVVPSGASYQSYLVASHQGTGPWIYERIEYILPSHNMPEPLGYCMLWSLFIPLCLAVVYHLVLFVVVSIVDMADTSCFDHVLPATATRDDGYIAQEQQHLLLLESIATRTWYRLLQGGLVGACCAMVVAAGMLSETRLVPLGFVMMLTSVGMVSGMLFCCDMSSSSIFKNRFFIKNNINNRSSRSSKYNSHYYYNDHDYDLEDVKRGKRPRHSQNEGVCVGVVAC